MKKLITVILAILMLCACGVNPQEEPEKEPEIKIVDEVSYTDESGKYGFHKDGVPVTEAIFDEIVHIVKIDDDEVYIDSAEDESENIYAGKITDGTRRTIKMFFPVSTGFFERENILYYLYEKGSASLINEIPLVNFNYVGLEGYGNSLNKLMINGSHEGDLYSYIREESGWELYEMQSGGVYNAYSEVFYMTRYYWKSQCCYYGLEKPDGTVIIEPVYGNIEILPYRFVLAYDGYSRITIDDFICTYIMDFEGNVICDEYNYVDFTFVQNGKFVMRAMVTDMGGDSHWYFIDEKGNKLSEGYNQIQLVFEDDGDAKNAKVLPDTKNYDPDAEYELISIEDYIIENTQ